MRQRCQLHGLCSIYRELIAAHSLRVQACRLHLLIRRIRGVLLLILMDIIDMSVEGLRMLSSLTCWGHLGLSFVLYSILLRCSHLVGREHLLSMRVSLRGLCVKDLEIAYASHW